MSSFYNNWLKHISRGHSLFFVQYAVKRVFVYKTKHSKMYDD